MEINEINSFFHFRWSGYFEVDHFFDLVSFFLPPPCPFFLLTSQSNARLDFEGPAQLPCGCESVATTQDSKADVVSQAQAAKMFNQLRPVPLALNSELANHMSTDAAHATAEEEPPFRLSPRMRTSEHVRTFVHLSFFLQAFGAPTACVAPIMTAWCRLRRRLQQPQLPPVSPAKIGPWTSTTIRARTPRFLEFL